jgi:hypothetical protein
MEPVYIQRPASSGTGKKIFGAIVILGAFVLMAAVIAASVYFSMYYEPSAYKPLAKTECSTDAKDLGDGCYHLSGYDLYTGSKIVTPATGGSDVAFTSEKEITSFECAQKCDKNCKSALCVGATAGATLCKCTGYTIAPTKLGDDEKTTVIVKSS